MFKAEDQAEENKKTGTPENNKQADEDDSATNEDTEKGKNTYMGKIKIIF